MGKLREEWKELNDYEKVLGGAVIVAILTVVVMILCVFGWIWKVAPGITGKVFLSSAVILVVAVITGVVAVKLEK
jgi:hypothetical protein